MVVKKGGQREAFDRYKMLSGLKKACEKRPVSVHQMEEVVQLIESKLLETGEKEVSSEMIGELVIEQIQQLDPVAYVRFASVYREFSDVSEFMETLRSFLSTTEAKPSRESVKSSKGKQQPIPLTSAKRSK